MCRPFLHSERKDRLAGRLKEIERLYRMGLKQAELEKEDPADAALAGAYPGPDL